MLHRREGARHRRKHSLHDPHVGVYGGGKGRTYKTSQPGYHACDCGADCSCTLIRSVSTCMSPAQLLPCVTITSDRTKSECQAAIVYVPQETACERQRPSAFQARKYSHDACRLCRYKQALRSIPGTAETKACPDAVHPVPLTEWATMLDQTISPAPHCPTMLT